MIWINLNWYFVKFNDSVFIPQLSSPWSGGTSSNDRSSLVCEIRPCPSMSVVIWLHCLIKLESSLLRITQNKECKLIRTGCWCKVIAWVFSHNHGTVPWNGEVGIKNTCYSHWSIIQYPAYHSSCIFQCVIKTVITQPIIYILDSWLLTSSIVRLSLPVYNQKDNYHQTNKITVSRKIKTLWTTLFWTSWFPFCIGYGLVGWLVGWLVNRLHHSPYNQTVLLWILL